MRLSPALVVAGTLLPIAGAVGTGLLALVLRGAARWTALLVGPALTAAGCYLIASPVMADGNLLAAIVYILYAVLLMAYYPALVIVALVIRLRRRKAPAS